MKKMIALILSVSIFCTSVFASSIGTRRPFPYEQGIALAKNVLYLNARELSAGAGLSTLWSDTFKDSTQINSGSSTGYTYRGSSNFDVILNSTGTNVTPLMTTASAPSPHVVSQDSIVAGGYEGWKAFDGTQAGNGFASASTAPPHWVKLDFGSGQAKTLGSYKISVDDYLNGAPYTWTFQGSNDDSAWTTVDTQTAQTFSQNVFRTFTFSNSTAYRYYRIYVTANRSGNQTAISEMQFFTGGSSSSVVRSVTTTFASSVSEVMVFVDMTLNTGSITLVRVSANSGSTWKTVTNNLEQVVSLGHSGTGVILEVTFTGDAELEFWGVSA